MDEIRENLDEFRTQFGDFSELKHKIRFGPHRNGRILPKLGLSQSNPYVTMWYH
jgi:hypothetical protein